jgi:hypothetical protein
MPMKELHSFRDVIESNFYAEIEAAVSNYIRDNTGRLDVRSRMSQPSWNLR